jgi:hypothetical protein
MSEELRSSTFDDRPEIIGLFSELTQPEIRNWLPLIDNSSDSVNALETEARRISPRSG